MDGFVSDVFELSEREQIAIKDIKLPYIVKGHTIFSPGSHNDMYYSASVIQGAYSSTNWDKRVRSLFLDHDDMKAEKWLGFVENIKFRDDGFIVGDLELWDLETAIKLMGGAKFGVSPRVKGSADEQNTMKQFYFENFSIVMNPAVKTTYLNSQITKTYSVSTTAWGDVDKTQLPASCFAYVPDPENRSTWKLPYKTADGSINLGGVKAAWAALQGARGGVKGVSQEAIDKIKAARDMLIREGHIKAEDENMANENEQPKTEDATAKLLEEMTAMRKELAILKVAKETKMEEKPPVVETPKVDPKIEAIEKAMTELKNEKAEIKAELAELKAKSEKTVRSTAVADNQKTEELSLYDLDKGVLNLFRDMEGLPPVE